MSEIRTEKKDEKTIKGGTISKDSLLKSREFKDKKDLIAVLLDDNKLYSKEEVYSAIKNYFKRSGF